MPHPSLPSLFACGVSRSNITCYTGKCHVSFLIFQTVGDLGTLFLELWKRQNSTVAYQWDVNDFEEQVRSCCCVMVHGHFNC